ncbi:uncharacterized protein [Elaeis guineensis]|uniref:Uncharacterized protein LOC105047503 n=1 Tax=Elaeis guineensis var. tenera TaxID=51953 RepID=A0A6I9RKQ5_ELAGV|nr:uncharacterized protein LOC105047503 [Elaeis guineensis]
MAIGDLFHTVSVLVNTCTKHMSRATRRIRSHGTFSKLSFSKSRAAPFLARGASFIPFLDAKKKGVEGEGDDDKTSKSSEEEEEIEEEERLWQRTILMGEKCQPLDFSGVIYYDSAGRQLKELPFVPRSPLRSPLPSFATHNAVVHSEEV